MGNSSVLTGPRQPSPPLVPDQGALAAFSLRPWLAPKSWPLGAKTLPLSQPETMLGQQNNLPHTGAQSSQSLNVWAHWLLCPASWPRAACILGPRCAPPHTPPAEQSLLLGVLGLVAYSWALVTKEEQTE